MNIKYNFKEEQAEMWEFSGLAHNKQIFRIILNILKDI